MTTQWTCPKCGHPAQTLAFVVKDHKPGESVLDGPRRYTPIGCSFTSCDYRDGFPDDDPAVPED